MIKQIVIINPGDTIIVHGNEFVLMGLETGTDIPPRVMFVSPMEIPGQRTVTLDAILLRVRQALGRVGLSRAISTRVIEEISESGIMFKDGETS